MKRAPDRPNVFLPTNDRGSGQPILLINGLDAPQESWTPLRQHLSKCRTITFDLPGCGAAPAPQFPRSIAHLAALAANVLDHVGLETAHLVGFSLGGAVAQELALRRPDRVASLVLMSTATSGFPTTDARVLLSLMSMRRWRGKAAYTRAAPTLLGGRVRTDPDFREEIVQQRMANKPTAKAHYSQLLAAARWTSLTRLHRLNVPTLILQGDDDPLISPLQSHILRALIPDSSRTLLTGGHLLPLERPAEVAKLIQQHIAAHPITADDGSGHVDVDNVTAPSELPQAK